MATRGGRSIAFLCRHDGSVIEVFLDEISLTPQLAPGVFFTNLVDPRSLGKAIDFLRQVQKTGLVLCEKLYITHPRRSPGVFFYGVRTAHGIAVYGATKRLEAATHGSAKLLALATHDLRNPIAGILAASQYLLEDALNKREGEYTRLLESIESASHFLLRLVDDLLDISEMRSGKFRFDFQPTDLVTLINQALAMNRVLMQSKRIRVSVVVEVPIPSINADPARVSQVIDNLLANAVKFSQPGGAIEVRVGLRQKMTTISVRDEGPGIPADEFETVFEAFRKSRNQNGSGERGIGLGLAIVKLIVEGHGGRIEVESQVGHGSTFTILLPISGKASARTGPRRRTALVAASRPAASGGGEA